MLAVTATLPLAFLAGLLSFLSPCVFPLMPAYAAYLGGQANSPMPAAGGTARRVPLLGNGIAFVLGFSAVFVVFFYVLVALEISLVTTHRHAVNVASGVIVILLGLHTMGLLRIPWLMRERRFHVLPQGGGGGAFLLGITFAAGWSPCLGPVLGGILQVAVDGGFSGLPLMLVYCLGLAVPFLLVAVLADRLQGWIRAVNRHLGVINIIAGCLLLIFGVLLALDRITTLSTFAPGSPFDI
ncbi:MAG: cytochrome c biogenesis CcdA family protein [Candidatus Dormibacteria bacterium]